MSSFDDEARKQARRLPAIQRETQAEILRQLKRAQARVLAQVAGATPDAARKLRQQQAAISDAITKFTTASDAALQSGLGSAWSAGIEAVGAPARVAGMLSGPQLAIDTRSLLAMRSFVTHRIKDIGAQAVDRVNGILAQAMIGATPMHEAITQVQSALGGATRQRAMTIAYTNIGSAYSQASYDAMLEAEKRGVNLAKRWLKSGKLHPRPSHVHAHNQIVRVSEPFLIVDGKTGQVEELRFPRDLKASAGNVINCGCVMVPVVSGSRFGAGVVDLPENPRHKPRVVPRVQREMENRAVVDRVNDRLSRFLDEDIGDTTGLKVTRGKDFR